MEALALKATELHSPVRIPDFMKPVLLRLKIRNYIHEYFNVGKIILVPSLEIFKKKLLGCLKPKADCVILLFLN